MTRSHRTLACFHGAARKSKRPPTVRLLRWAAHAGEGPGPAGSEFRSDPVTEQGVCSPRPGRIRPGNLAYPSPGTRRGLPRARASSSRRGLAESRRLPAGGPQAGPPLARGLQDTGRVRRARTPLPCRGRTPATRLGQPRRALPGAAAARPRRGPAVPLSPAGQASASGMRPESQAPAGNGPRRLPSPSPAP